MMPISKRLLIHNATAYTLSDTDADRNAADGDPIELSYVRCMPVKQNAFTSFGETKDDKLTFIFDCVISLPVGFVPMVQQYIDFAGQTYTVRSVSPCYGCSKQVHHYEAALI